MALHQLLARGVAAALSASPDELVEFVRSRGAPDEAATHLARTFEAMPGLLLALDGALYSAHNDGRAEPKARHLFNTVLRYLLLEDDLLPARGPARTLVGHLDDLYLLHRAAGALREHVEGVDFRSIDGGAALLASLLPEEVRVGVDARLEGAIAEVEQDFRPR